MNKENEPVKAKDNQSKKQEINKEINKEMNEKSDKEKINKDKTNKEKTSQKAVENKENKKNNEKIVENEQDRGETKNKIRKILVLVVLAIAAIIIYIVARGEYLEIREIGENYISIFWQNAKNLAIIGTITFLTVFTIIYITTKKVKIGLKTFFDDEKKQMPTLPHKSVAFIVAILVTIFTSGIILEKALPAIYNTQFVTVDPVLGMDIGYFVFIWPFLELVIQFALIAIIAATVYAAIYYLLVFNICFDGISRETVKKSKLLNQALTNLKIIIVLFVAFMLLETQNVGVQKFMMLADEQSENYFLYGAGVTETTIKFWGYIGLSGVILVSVFKAISNSKKGKTSKVIKWISIVPIYLVILGIGMFGFNVIFINSNELDKEKNYIATNISNTKKAYGIDIDEILIQDSGTITQSDITKNAETIKNIPIINAETVLKDLSSSLTTKGYYDFSSTQLQIYEIEGENQLVYITPREIASAKGTYNNKTYEYTHGFGTIITQATSTTESGNLNHIQKLFDQTDEKVNIVEPRIYFGLETNDTVVTNSNNKKEFDYPTEDGLNNTENVYDGPAGLEANFFDRLILAIKERDAKLLFSGNVKNDSKIVTNRNVIERAKKIMPYLTYEEEPYTVITNDGQLVWVLDAYTTSNNYPYAQRTTLKNNGISKEEINYIRNSVKVIINAYSGEVTFYITDKTDPIAMVYKKIYPDLFTDEEIPEDISNHLVYPQYLYKIQAEILERYHNIQPDVLYRSDDIWDVATHNTSSKMTSTKGVNIEPYYTMVKTTDSNSSRLGLVLPYTPYGKQNITAYLIGSIDEKGNNILKLYNYSTDSNILGPMQLDTQLEQDETISQEIDSLNVTGTKITKDIIIVPIDNTLLYIEPIYQQYVNEKDSRPVLKKVVVASGTKVSIGNTFTEALNNLVSQYAVNIELENTDDLDELITLVIRANENVKTSTQSNNWEQMGKDVNKLQELIDRLENLKKELDKEKNQTKENVLENQTLDNVSVVNEITE